MKNKCLKALKSILRSNYRSKSFDLNQNVVYIDADVFGNKLLNTFLDLSLSDFNQTPYFTFFTFNDEKFVNTFINVLVEGAILYALSSQALIERGREFVTTDNGIEVNPPNVSEMMQTQYHSLIHLHFEKLKLIKSSIRDF
jgi:hypothetical protein